MTNNESIKKAVKNHLQTFKNKGGDLTALAKQANVGYYKLYYFYTGKTVALDLDDARAVLKQLGHDLVIC